MSEEQQQQLPQMQSRTMQNFFNNGGALQTVNRTGAKLDKEKRAIAQAHWKGLKHKQHLLTTAAKALQEEIARRFACTGTRTEPSDCE